MIKDWVAQNAGRRPDSIALADAESGAQLSWSQLEDRVGRLARVLLDRGVRPGERVALLAENDIRIFEAQFACMRIGAILVPLSWRLTERELRQQIDEAAPALFINDTEWTELAARLVGATPVPTLRWGAADATYEVAIEAVTEPVPGDELDPDAITHVLYTSGTTGEPKGVLCTNRTLVAQAQNLAHSSRMAHEDAHHLNIVPLFHAGGLNVFSNPMLYWGGRVTTTRRFDAAQTLRLLADAELGITHLCGVLQMYEWLIALPEFASARLPTLRTVLFGGWGPSAAEIYRAFAGHDIWVQLSYGASEVGPNVSVLSQPDLQAAERGTSGTILAHTMVRLVGADGEAVPPEQTGEIWVRGPGVTPGYWRKSRDDFFSGDWFRTGDAGRIDPAGHLYIVGRVKEMYRSGGENVYPAEVEGVLAEMHGLAEFAVVGVPDEKWGEVGLLAAVLQSGASVTLDDVRAFADGRLARFKLPAALLVLDELPRSATAKIARPTIRQIWLDRVAHG